MTRLLFGADSVREEMAIDRICRPDVPVGIRRTDTAATHFIGFVAQWADTIYLAVEDQYANPVSNVPVTFQVQHVP